MTKKMCVLGLGYIGLPTSAMFAKSGWEVLGVDVNPSIVEKLNNGDIHIEEEGLDKIVYEQVQKGTLKASLKPSNADCFIIAVPTPNNDNRSANLDYVIEATKSISPYINRGNTVIVESTIPPRTVDDVVAPILEQTGLSVGEDIYLAHCPERVLPGRILIELVENTRVVGGVNQKSAEKAAEIYKSFVQGEIILTSALSAEMSKLMENTYRDVNIALANELAKISERLGINTLEVIELANHHPRVNIHLPGPGVGGHCLAVDPYFIIEKAKEESVLISKAREINNSMPEFVVQQIQKIVPDQKAKISVFGLAYKGNIDDIRESPALEIVNLLQQIGYSIGLYDPHVSQDKINYLMSSFEDAIEGAHCIVVLTDHNEFKQLNEEKLIKLMMEPNVFDTKNCVRIKNSNINYFNYGNLYKINKDTKIPLK